MGRQKEMAQVTVMKTTDRLGTVPDIRFLLCWIRTIKFYEITSIQNYHSRSICEKARLWVKLILRQLLNRHIQ